MPSRSSRSTMSMMSPLPTRAWPTVASMNHSKIGTVSGTSRRRRTRDSLSSVHDREFLEKAMVQRSRGRIELLVHVEPLGVLRGQLRIGFVRLPVAIDALAGVLLVPVQADADAGQQRGAQRRRFFDLRGLDRAPDHIGLVLHPERVARRAAHGDDTLQPAPSAFSRASTMSRNW